MSNTDTVRAFLANNTHDDFTAASIAKAVGLESKQVSSVLYRMAKAGDVLKSDNGYRLRTAEAPVAEKPEEDLIGTTADEASPEAPEAVEEDETVFSAYVDFPGNYSIVGAPFAEEIAAAAGVPTKVEKFKGSLVRRVHFGGDVDRTDKVARVVSEAYEEALSVLHDWQKANADKRRGLTDMQKYIQHRDVIAEHGHKVAARVKKDGI